MAFEAAVSIVRRVAPALVIAVLAVLPRPLPADDLPQPSGQVILTVSGELGAVNSGDVAEFDFGMLAALPWTIIETSTPWTEGTVQFTGVRIADLLDVLGVHQGTLTAVALNDYRVEIPVADAWDADPIIAYLRDGEPMSVRDKGPLWVIHEFDNTLALNREVYFNRSIWQLRHIDVRAH